jgi:hypothetical protein
MEVRDKRMTRYETLITRLESTLPSVNLEELRQLMSSASPPLVGDVKEATYHLIGAIISRINLSKEKLEATIESHIADVKLKQVVINVCQSKFLIAPPY